MEVDVDDELDLDAMLYSAEDFQQTTLDIDSLDCSHANDPLTASASSPPRASTVRKTRASVLLAAKLTEKVSK